MATKTKADLIKEGKELGLNLNSKMSIYELEHRIKDRQEEIAQKEQPKEKKSTKKGSGEH